MHTGTEFTIKAYYPNQQQAYIEHPTFYDRNVAIKTAGQIFDNNPGLCEVEVVESVVEFDTKAGVGSIRQNEHIIYVAECRR